MQEFDGVEMVLVPAGCFMMGSTEQEIDAAFEVCKSASTKCEHEYGRDWFAGEAPLSPLNARVGAWPYDANGYYYGHGDISFTARDVAKPKE
jgi:hypothetical protein